MSMLSYWLESLGYALEEAGAYDALTPEQRKQVAESLVVSAENEGMASGRECIPNPLNSEIERLKAAHRAEIARFEDRERIFCRDIARSQNVETQRIGIHNGSVVIHRS
ncbi:hypothetical protein [Burkholderia multivorans]|uniref:hypothetical protein n=1 Tax=Burkholderia multivorans TaxID=87883 RepID=UPI0021BE9F9C|nr:hypothetical protein [Burkholderia multivorans]